MSTQLALDLRPRTTPRREQPVIDRLRAVLKRMGINWHWRHTGGGSWLLRPLLASRCGYQPMCGFYCCGDFTFERLDYFDRPALTPEEREAWSKWREEVWRASHHELWGKP
jgi:hypothetical protein